MCNAAGTPYLSCETVGIEENVPVSGTDNCEQGDY
jgi:hypothetical protein